MRGLRRALVWTSVAANLTLLFSSRHTGWVFPLGLSFYTFQSLTYTLDLYRRDGEGTRSLLAYLSAVTFFPTLQAGPITRVSELIKQFAGRRRLDRVEGGRAFFLIALGLLKKAVIADYLAENLVNRVFDTPKLYSGAEVLIAVYAYSLQLYYDFSGYTDIARGTAQLLGIRLPINFDRPYSATNLTDFWRRWHISFSNWLRDYLYFSLPGARTKVMPYVNLVITMLLGGLWHGLTWTFAIWGLLHGAGAGGRRGRTWCGAAARGKRRRPWRRVLAVVGTYQFVCLTWVFFRAGSVSRRDGSAGPHRLALGGLRERRAAVRRHPAGRRRRDVSCANSGTRRRWSASPPAPSMCTRPRWSLVALALAIAGRTRQHAVRLFPVLTMRDFPIQTGLTIALLGAALAGATHADPDSASATWWSSRPSVHPSLR